MGLFTQDCKSCGNPLLATFNTEGRGDWMSHGISINRDGTRIEGLYNGYGELFPADSHDEEGAIRCVGTDFNTDGTYAGTGPTIWHHACWIAAGSPPQWQGESPSSDDQGHFFDEGTYDLPKPLNLSGSTWWDA